MLAFFGRHTLKSCRLNWGTVLLIARTAREDIDDVLGSGPVNGEKGNPIRRLGSRYIEMCSLEPISLVGDFQTNGNAQCVHGECPI